MDAITDLGVVIDGCLRFERQVRKVVFEGLCHTAQAAFAEVPDAVVGQIEAL
jgi:hypothetical protein